MPARPPAPRTHTGRCEARARQPRSPPAAPQLGGRGGAPLAGAAQLTPRAFRAWGTSFASGQVRNPDDPSSNPKKRYPKNECAPLVQTGGGNRCRTLPSLRRHQRHGQCLNDSDRQSPAAPPKMCGACMQAECKTRRRRRPRRAPSCCQPSATPATRPAAAAPPAPAASAAAPAPAAAVARAAPAAPTARARGAAAPPQTPPRRARTARAA